MRIYKWYAINLLKPIFAENKKKQTTTATNRHQKQTKRHKLVNEHQINFILFMEKIFNPWY